MEIWYWCYNLLKKEPDNIYKHFDIIEEESKRKPKQNININDTPKSCTKNQICFQLLLCTFGTIALAQQQQKYTTPVPILKQINRQNDDGSYSYGYEAADGSFKIETKYPTGEVHGKYGYIDDQGQKREVEYGASKQRGFEPAGEDLKLNESWVWLFDDCLVN